MDNIDTQTETTRVSNQPSEELSLAAKLEAILFYRGEPVSAKNICKLLNCSEEELTQAKVTLSETLHGHGLVLMDHGGELELRTSAQASELIESIRKQELTKDLGKAGAETLAIVLYKGPVTRSEIDYIRGVNSSFILRNLLVRGLVERSPSPEDARTHRYQVSMDLLAHLGVTDIASLPDYDVVQRELENFIERTEGGDPSAGVE